MFVVQIAELTVNSKCPVKQVLCSSDHSVDHRKSSATVFVLLICFAQQLGLQIPVILAPAARRQTSKTNTADIRLRRMIVLRLPVVENLWDLSSRLVGPIATQAAGAEGEGHTIGALHRGHTSIPISSSTAIVSQSDGILHPLLREITFIIEISCMLTNTRITLRKHSCISNYIHFPDICTLSGTALSRRISAISLGESSVL